jgi:tetratricopeptide (TPR) repeat protein
MQYRKIVAGPTIIEFHNNWLGQETVIVNGQMVSKKSSILGTSHHFTIPEDGKTIRYIVTSRVDDNMHVLLDVSRNGQLIHNELRVHYGSRPKNLHKSRGLAKLQKYDLDDALLEFEKALEQEPKDAEVYFHMACAYSVQEKLANGYQSLQRSIEYGLQDKEMILNHDMLAFLRMHPAFDGFVRSGFKIYELEEKSRGPEKPPS